MSVTYICKYTPIELLSALGEEAFFPNDEVEDFTESDALIHSSVCSHAKQLLTRLSRGLTERKPCEEACGQKPHIILTNCCDSIRRVYDTLLSHNLADPPLILDLPHHAGDTAAAAYARELDRLVSLFDSFSRTAFLGAWKITSERWKTFLSRSEPFFAVMGARAGSQLLAKLESTLALPVADLTCGGLRTLPPPPEDASSLSMDSLMLSYARALLSQIPCTRMQDLSARDSLLNDLTGRGLRGIIYHTVRFCDYYSFEYASIRRQTKLPMLKLESDYTVPSEGQLSTRIIAFRESLPQSTAGTEKTSGENMHTLYSPHNPEFSASPIAIGIDSGSTTTNVIAIDSQGKVLASTTVRTGAKAGDAAGRALEEIKKRLGSEAGRISRILATGYGRDYISLAHGTRTEISCHALGAHFMDPGVRTIIDIGGQDSKVICLDENGNVTNFIMNDKCAAGTGRFLEMMAHTLEMPLDAIAGYGLKWKQDLTISSVCTVFAESEVVSLIAQNHDLDDIIHALDKAVASKTVSMVKRAKGIGPYMMTGGVARNTGVARQIEERLGEKLAIAEEPDMAGALGAALFALQ